MLSPPHIKRSNSQPSLPAADAQCGATAVTGPTLLDVLSHRPPMATLEQQEATHGQSPKPLRCEASSPTHLESRIGASSQEYTTLTYKLASPKSPHYASSPVRVERRARALSLEQVSAIEPVSPKPSIWEVSALQSPSAPRMDVAPQCTPASPQHQRNTDTVRSSTRRQHSAPPTPNLASHDRRRQVAPREPRCGQHAPTQAPLLRDQRRARGTSESSRPTSVPVREPRQTQQSTPPSPSSERQNVLIEARDLASKFAAHKHNSPTPEMYGSTAPSEQDDALTVTTASAGPSVSMPARRQRLASSQAHLSQSMKQLAPFAKLVQVPKPVLRQQRGTLREVQPTEETNAEPPRQSPKGPSMGCTPAVEPEGRSSPLKRKKKLQRAAGDSRKCAAQKENQPNRVDCDERMAPL